MLMDRRAYKKQWRREHHARNRAAGLCARDGNPVLPGRLTCAKCTEYRTQYEEAKRAVRLCAHCGEAEVRPKYQYCERCKDIVDHERRKRVYAERLALGICTRCGGALDGKRKKCNACSDRENARRREGAQPKYWCIDCKEHPRDGGRLRCADCWAANNARVNAARAKRNRIARVKRGLCMRCGRRKPRSGMKHCRSCVKHAADGQMVLRDQRAESGLCTRCGKVEMPEGKWCPDCAARHAKIQYKLSHKPVTETESWWLAQADRWGLEEMPSDIATRDRVWRSQDCPEPTDAQVLSRMPARARERFERWIVDGRKPFPAEAVWNAIRKASPK